MSVSETAEDSGLRGGGIASLPEYTARRNAFRSEILAQRLARAVLADYSHKVNARPEFGQVVCRIRASSRNDLPVPFMQNKDRRLAGNTVDFSVYKFVRYEIAEHDNPLAREAVDETEQRRAFLSGNLHSVFF